ncbi:HK97 family phage prohead protease [Laceyella sacchari]|uniref:HK97 family phage prohead protease n=1 Tax=Laceyella sacchari TaxID=37482 RepID=A0ABY5U1E5_LACSH|nr:HK97 family phage prohead protease [Laceyella sacchari]UWE03481.1 HK97 family phage prohead protease [Laceyella sacchari]
MSRPFPVIHRIRKAKDAEEGALLLEGYASTFHERDRHGDTIDPKAFDDSIEQYMKNPILLAYHDHKKPIGQVLEAHLDQRGLYVVAQVNRSPDPHLEGIRKQIELGTLRSFSIGGYFHRRQLAPHRHLIEKIDLVEISVVSVPANPHAAFQVQKGARNAWGTDADSALEYGTPISFKSLRISEAGNVRRQLSSFSASETLRMRVFVTGANTGRFLHYLFGIKEQNRASFAFELEGEMGELNQRLRVIEHYAKRTGVSVKVDSPCAFRRG